MKDVAFLVNRYHSINVNKLIIEQLKGEKTFSTDPYNIYTLSFSFSNCFRSASLVKELVEHIELDKHGCVIVSPTSINYGSGDKFQKIGIPMNEMDGKLMNFLNEDYDNENMSRKKYKSLIVNLLDCTNDELKYVTNWLNPIVVSNRTQRLDVYVLITRLQLDQYQSKFAKVLINTSNFIDVEDFSALKVI